MFLTPPVAADDVGLSAAAAASGLDESVWRKVPDVWKKVAGNYISLLISTFYLSAWLVFVMIFQLIIPVAVKPPIEQVLILFGTQG